MVQGNILVYEPSSEKCTSSVKSNPDLLDGIILPWESQTCNVAKYQQVGKKYTEVLGSYKDLIKAFKNDKK